VVHSNQSPVRDYTSNTKSSIWELTGNEILHSSGIKQLDVRELQNFTQKRARKQSSMFHDNKIPLIFILHSKFPQKGISRLAHNHSREELSAKPSSSTGRHGSFNDSNLKIRTSFAEHVSGGKTA
jgi:hypothetical protein